MTPAGAEDAARRLTELRGLLVIAVTHYRFSTVDRARYRASTARSRTPICASRCTGGRAYRYINAGLRVAREIGRVRRAAQPRRLRRGILAPVERAVARHETCGGQRRARPVRTREFEDRVVALRIRLMDRIPFEI